MVTCSGHQLLCVNKATLTRQETVQTFDMYTLSWFVVIFDFIFSDNTIHSFGDIKTSSEFGFFAAREIARAGQVCGTD